MEQEDCDLLSLLRSCDKYAILQSELAGLISDGCFHLSKARKSSFTRTTSVEDIRFEIDPIIRESIDYDRSAIRKPKKTIQIQAASDLVDELISRGVKVVTFDMDQCIVAKHSLGSLLNTENDIYDYTSKTTEDFIVTAKIMHERGLLLAVATHSDEDEHGSLRPVGQYILGEPLVQKVLEYSVPELISNFKIVAYNPSSRNDKDPKRAGKKHHIKEIADFYSVSTSEVILFDDDPRNISDTDDLFRAVQVCENLGFRVVSALHGARRTDFVSTGGGVMLDMHAEKVAPLGENEAVIEQDVATTTTTTTTAAASRMTGNARTSRNTNTYSSTADTKMDDNIDDIADKEDPLLLFGALPPPSLRSAQTTFDHAVQIILQGAREVRNIHNMRKRLQGNST